MSLDFSIRPVGAPVATIVVQAPSPAVSNAVATVLPANQSVTVAEPSASVRNDVQSISDEAVSHQAFYDRAAASLVFQVVDNKNAQVVDQYPRRGGAAPPRLFPRARSVEELTATRAAHRSLGLTGARLGRSCLNVLLTSECDPPGSSPALFALTKSLLRLLSRVGRIEIGRARRRVGD